MGQDASTTADMLTKDQILTCPYCRKRYNLNNRAPVMVCSSQHNFCEECLEEVIKTKKCLQCKDVLLLKKRRNVLLCYILEKLNLPESESEKAESPNSNSKFKKSQSVEMSQFRTIESPERKVIKIKTVKQQSIPNLNLQLYKEQRQFRKKYSVASIFSATKDSHDSAKKKKEEEQNAEDPLTHIAEQYQITPFKKIIAQKTEVNEVKTLDLHLFKIPKIFDVFSTFKSLVRLNLNKNKIAKIENVSELKQLKYLSLSENQIEVIENLDELTDLRNLYLNRNRIDKIERLQHLVELQFLGLGFNAIHKIENIAHLLQLRWLNLQCNYISKIQGIMTLTKLEIILLGSNEIAVFQGFENFPALMEIHLQNNKITDLGKALSMKHLRKIKLQENPGLKQGNSEQYLKLLEIIQAKSKGIQKSQENCQIY